MGGLFRLGPQTAGLSEKTSPPGGIFCVATRQFPTPGRVSTVTGRQPPGQAGQLHSQHSPPTILPANQTR